MIGLSFACVLALAPAPAPLAGVDWEDVLGPSQAKLPDPLPSVRWRTNLRTSMLEAVSTGRPVFVTFRCLPCKQCADFDCDSGLCITATNVDAAGMDQIPTMTRPRLDHDHRPSPRSASPDDMVSGCVGESESVTHDSSREPENGVAELCAQRQW